MGISFYNSGQKTGQIRDVRVLAEIDDSKKKDVFGFYPKWIVKYDEFHKAGVDRFDWLESGAVVADWYPVILGSKDSSSLHVILESNRWEEKKKGKMRFRIEVLSTESDIWVKSDEYLLPITDDMFDSKSSYTAYDSKKYELRKNEKW